MRNYILLFIYSIILAKIKNIILYYIIVYFGNLMKFIKIIIQYVTVILLSYSYSKFSFSYSDSVSKFGISIMLNYID